MLFLRIKTDVIMNNCGMQISDKNVVKSHRQDIFTSLPIQRVWLYLKVSRNLSRFDLDDFMIQKEPLVLDGPEDIVAKTSKYSKMMILCCVSNHVGQYTINKGPSDIQSSCSM